jgi:LytS/YehU family sensor histidine kinase
MTIRKPFLLSFSGLSLIFAGLAGICLLIYYYTRKSIIRKEEEKQHIAQLKHKAVQAKFIPHFTGNVLNSISYLTVNNPDSARKYISKFSYFSNQTLRIADKQYRSLKDELEYSQLYLELEKLRFEEKLDYSLSIDPAVNLQKMIPTMVLQTFCENAIKHGLRPKPEGGCIVVRVYQAGDSTVVAVEDNGVGRAMAEASKTQGTQEGLKIVQQQLDIFNRRQPKAICLNVVDLFDENGRPAGTCFELHI